MKQEKKMSKENFTGTFSKEDLGLTVLSNEIIEMIRDPYELALWAYLSSFPEGELPTIKHTAERFGLSEDKTRKLFHNIKNLINKGI